MVNLFRNTDNDSRTACLPLVKPSLRKQDIWSGVLLSLLVASFSAVQQPLGIAYDCVDNHDLG